MKLPILLSLSLSCALVFAAQAQAQSPDAAKIAKGQETFKARCAGCHEGGGAPPADVIGQHKPAEIVDILTNGKMQAMASGLSDDDKSAIAAYLTAPKAAPAPAAPAAPDAAQIAKGMTTFKARCAGCHEGGSGPPVDVIGQNKPADIVEILTTGPMQAMASGLSDGDKAAIAAYLTAPKATAAK